MAISLKNHDDRITNLEKSVKNYSFTPNVPGFKLIESRNNYYTIIHDKICIIHCYNFGYVENMNKVVLTWYFPVKFVAPPVVVMWDVGVGQTDQNYWINENLPLALIEWPKLESVKFRFTNNCSNFQAIVIGLLKLYYNFSYNKLMHFLSHLNTKFGGERR